MICITWWGLPQYGARAIGAFVRQTNEPVVVVSTRPVVPIKGMEELVGCPLHWVPDEGADIMSLLPEVPRVLVVGNWNLPMYEQVAKEVRAVGGKVFALSDANYVLDFRQLLRKVRFMLTIRRRFDGFFVPGKSGRRLMRFYGVPDERIFEGLYAADQDLFKSAHPLPQRPRKILYVGQFIARKNVVRLVEAFLSSGITREGWSLEMCGSGVLKDRLDELAARSEGAVRVRDFVQPEQLAAYYADARCFVLPSLEEHWGVVVHEAVLSGCYLLLSKGIGAADDFARPENSCIFDPLRVEEMKNAFSRMAALDDAALLRGEALSVKLGIEAGTQKFVRSLQEMCK